MAQAGIRVALRTDDRMQNYRNLPFHAGFAVAYGQEVGFDRQAALDRSARPGDWVTPPAAKR